MVDNLDNSAKFSLGPRSDAPCFKNTAAAMDFAIRILNNPELGVGRDQALAIINRKYPGADLDFALLRAHNIVRGFEGDWAEVQARSSREAALVVARTTNASVEVLKKIYERVQQKSCKEYLRCEIIAARQKHLRTLSNEKIKESGFTRIRQSMNRLKRRLIERLPTRIEINFINKNRGIK